MDGCKSQLCKLRTYIWRIATKTIKTILISLFISLSLTGVSFGQERSLVTGDAILIEESPAVQIGNQPITFDTAKPKQLKYWLSIQENGDRHYLRGNKSISFAYDKFFASIISKGNPIKEGDRFIPFPPNKKLSVGMEWDVPAMEIASKCFGNTKLIYHAISKNGPEITLLVDDKDVVIKTILVDYKATLGHKTDSCDKYDRVKTILYSEELNEIVSESFTEIRGPFLIGSGWKKSLKSVRVANVPTLTK